MRDIQLRRVYDMPAQGLDGAVFLVDGMWPRGVSKDRLPLDGWLRDLAPSKELRQWFGHRSDRWEGFRDSYRKELDDSPEALAPLLEAAEKERKDPVTLLYTTKNTEHNNAIVLREYVREVLQRG